MANVKFIAVSRGLRGIVDSVTNREKTVEQLISGVNCVARTAVPEFEAVKKQFRKTEGRGYYHIVQAFAPDDPLDFATAHELGVKLAEHPSTVFLRLQRYCAISLSWIKDCYTQCAFQSNTS